MAGKMCMGNIDVPNNPILSRAYCEGRRLKADAYPGAWKNPHPEGSPANLAAKRGGDSWDSPTGDVSPRDCCDIRGREPPTP